MTNRDLQLLREIVENYIPNRVPTYLTEVFGEEKRKIEHPLDEEVKEKLSAIKTAMREELLV